MNLKRISDAVSLKAYKNLKSIDPSNFYFVIANAIANALEKGVESISGKALGNDYQFKSKNGQNSITVSGRTFTSDQKSTVRVIEDLVKQLFDAEFNGLKINRPNGRTLLKDRTSFKDAEGTVFPSMYKKVKKDNPLANNQPNNANYLTEAQFETLKEERKAFKPNTYERYEAGGTSFYVKKGIFVWEADKDLEDAGLPKWTNTLREYSDVLYHKYPDARKFYDLLSTGISYCILKNKVYECTYDGSININRKEL